MTYTSEDANHVYSVVNGSRPIINIIQHYVNNETSLNLYGREVSYYGEDYYHNIIWLLEHFANAYPPINPMIGQIWYDNANKEIKLYNGNWVSFPAPVEYVDDCVTKIDDYIEYLTVNSIPKNNSSVTNKKYVDSWLYDKPINLSNNHIKGIKFPTNYYIGWGDVDIKNKEIELEVKNEDIVLGKYSFMTGITLKFDNGLTVYYNNEIATTRIMLQFAAGIVDNTFSGDISFQKLVDGVWLEVHTDRNTREAWYFNPQDVNGCADLRIALMYEDNKYYSGNIIDNSFYVFKATEIVTNGGYIVKFPKQMVDTNYSVITTYNGIVLDDVQEAANNFTVNKWKFEDLYNKSYDEDTIPVGKDAIWSVLPNRAGLKIQCSSEKLYTGTATTTLINDNPFTLVIKLSGEGETIASGYELMEVYIDGVLYASATSVGGDSGDILLLKPVVITNNYPNGILLSASVEHTIDIKFDTGDYNYDPTKYYPFANTGIWYQFEFVYDYIKKQDKTIPPQIILYDKTINYFKIHSSVPFNSINFVVFGFITDNNIVIPIKDDDETIEGVYNKTISGNLLKNTEYKITKIEYELNGILISTNITEKTKIEILDIGVFNVDVNGGWSFTPNNNFAGEIPVITYTLTDGQQTDTSTLTISPIISPAIIDEDEEIEIEGKTEIDVFKNLTKIDGLTYTLTKFSINGNDHTDTFVMENKFKVSMDPKGIITFEPINNYAAAGVAIYYTIDNGLSTKVSSLTVSVKKVLPEIARGKVHISDLVPEPFKTTPDKCHILTAGANGIIDKLASKAFTSSLDAVYVGSGVKVTISNSYGSIVIDPMTAIYTTRFHKVYIEPLTGAPGHKQKYPEYNWVGHTTYNEKLNLSNTNEIDWRGCTIKVEAA